jgi:hypothetical protein
VVQQHGGFDVATAKKRWGKVAKKLGVDLAAITNAGFVLRCAYRCSQLPFLSFPLTAVLSAVVTAG